MLLAVIPLVVMLVGVAGGRIEPDGTVTPSEVTYSKMVPVLMGRGNDVCIVFHEPFSVNVLPREKRRDVPDLREKSLMERGVSDMDQVVLSMMQDAEDEKFQNMGKNRKKPVSLLGKHDDKKDFDKRDSENDATPFKKDVDVGWGGGWLSDAVLSEERRVQTEMNSQLMNIEAESTSRGGFEYAPASRVTDRFGSTEGNKDGKLAPFKPSFRIESWKPKSK